MVFLWYSILKFIIKNDLGDCKRAPKVKRDRVCSINDGFEYFWFFFPFFLIRQHYICIKCIPICWRYFLSTLIYWWTKTLLSKYDVLVSLFSMETVFHAGFWHFSTTKEAFLLVLNRFSSFCLDDLSQSSSRAHSSSTFWSI